MADELVANFSLENIELNSNMELSECVNFGTQFVINASPEKVSQLENDLNFQTLTQVQEAITEATATYIHEQGISSDVWVINHNLNKFPSVTVVDTAETAFTAQVEYNNENTCTVYINGATKGKAYLN